MEFHYIVKYDSETDEWSLDEDTMEILDGNVWSEDDGWFYPAPEYPLSEGIDQKCRNMIDVLVPIWPSPLVNGEL